MPRVLSSLFYYWRLCFLFLVNTSKLFNCPVFNTDFNYLFLLIEHSNFFHKLSQSLLDEIAHFLPYVQGSHTYLPSSKILFLLTNVYIIYKYEFFSLHQLSTHHEADMGLSGSFLNLKSMEYLRLPHFKTYYFKTTIIKTSSLGDRIDI